MKDHFSSFGSFFNRTYKQYITREIILIKRKEPENIAKSKSTIIPRILSIVFAVCLLISSTPLYVYADGHGGSGSDNHNATTNSISQFLDFHRLHNYEMAWEEVGNMWVQTHVLPYIGMGSDDYDLRAMAHKRIVELRNLGLFYYTSSDEYFKSLYDYDETTDTVTITSEGMNVIYNTVYNGDYINNQYDNELSDNYRIGYTYDIHNFRTEVQKSDEYCNALEVLCDYVKSHNYTMLSDYNDNNYVWVYKTQFTYILSRVDNSTTYVKRYVLDSENVKQPFDRLDYHYSSVSHRFELQNTATLSPGTNSYEYTYRLLNQPNIDALSDYFYTAKWYSDCFMNDSYIGYRIYDSIEDLSSGNVPWQSYYSVGDTINNFSEIYNFITNHNEEYNTYITNYYD